MLLEKIEHINILNVKLSKVCYSDLLNLINQSINRLSTITITYCNAHIINLSVNNKSLGKTLNKIDVVHPDGIGIFLASKFLYGKNGFNSRFTGSDFYLHLIDYAVKQNWSFYFFGDEEKTLEKISTNYSELKIAGLCNGFTFNQNEIIDEINDANPDILIVGLGSPKQEEWVIENKGQVKAKVIIAVGEGIKVFAGTKKRGSKIVRFFGFEWLIRLINEPKRLWKRYLIGNPLFIISILKFKFIKREN